LPKINRLDTTFVVVNRNKSTQLHACSVSRSRASASWPTLRTDSFAVFSYLFTVASPGTGHTGTCPPWSLMHAVFFLLSQAFCGLKYAENAIAAGAPPRTSLGGSSRRSTRPPSRLRSGDPSPYPTPLGASMLAPSATRSLCPHDTKSWRRHCLFRQNLVWFE